MALFLKKGTHNANGQYIYPKPTQTKTGNCEAYAMASCLYAFGRDHEPGLIPNVPNGAGDHFQTQMARMVERLTELLYTNKMSDTPRGEADAARKYIEDCGLANKFTVTEATGNQYTLPDQTKRDTWDWIIDELRRCQNIIPSFKWPKDCCKDLAAHSVTLVGIDGATGEAIVMNPWGNPAGTENVPPDEAGRNTEAGQAERAFTRVKFHKAADGTITVDVPLAAKLTAEIYKYVIICPVTQVACLIEPRTGSSTTATGLAVRRYEYALTNQTFSPVNAVAIELPGIAAGDLAALNAPVGWSAGYWYRENEGHFNLPAPELMDEGEPGRQTFVGVIWRAADKSSILPEQRLSGFGFDMVIRGQGAEKKIAEIVGRTEDFRIPLLRRLTPVLRGVSPWEDDQGHVILLSEHPDGTVALHMGTTVPKRATYFPDLLDQITGVM